MKNYKFADDTDFTESYGVLRRWAEECEEVKNWMLKHLPHEIFEEEGLELEVGEFYVGHSGNLSKCVEMDNKFALIDVVYKGGMVGTHSSLASLSAAAAHYNYKKISRIEAVKLFEELCQNRDLLGS